MLPSASGDISLHFHLHKIVFTGTFKYLVRSKVVGGIEGIKIAAVSLFKTVHSIQFTVKLQI